MMSFRHQAVLAREVRSFLAPRAGGIYVDATLGGAGHAAEIAAAIAPGGTLLGIDRDAEAIAAARERLAFPGVRVILVHADFADLAEILDREGLAAVDGLLFDLGVSSPQVDQAERGFSYQRDAPLDMRMDRRQALTARRLVNETPERELAEIIRRYGEERWARRIAGFIAAFRRERAIETTGQLVEIIKAAVPAGARREGPHPARRTFQALRIAVNDELNALAKALGAGIERLALGGRLVAISFHSLEDRIVKDELAREAKACRCPPEIPVCRCGGPRLRLLTRRPVTASPGEIEENPRARSAKLRAALKLV